MSFLNEMKWDYSMKEEAPRHWVKYEGRVTRHSRNFTKGQVHISVLYTAGRSS